MPAIVAPINREVAMPAKVSKYRGKNSGFRIASRVAKQNSVTARTFAMGRLQKRSQAESAGGV